MSGVNNMSPVEVTIADRFSGIPQGKSDVIDGWPLRVNIYGNTGPGNEK